MTKDRKQIYDEIEIFVLEGVLVGGHTMALMTSQCCSGVYAVHYRTDPFTMIRYGETWFCATCGRRYNQALGFHTDFGSADALLDLARRLLLDEQ